MRIVHVLTRMLRAGSEENTAETCRWQAAAGHEVLLIHGAEIDPWWNDNPIPGVRMIGCPTIVHQVNPVADARALTALRTIYRDLMPDVIHTHQSKAGVLGRLAADTLPQALVVHGIHIVPFEGVSRLRRAVYLSAERAAARRTDHFIAVSQAAGKAYVGAGLADPSNVSCIRSGMALERFRSAGLPADWRTLLGVPDGPPPPVALMMAAFEPRKGHVEFLRALAAHTDAPARMRLILAGAGPETGAVRGAVAELGLTDRVVLAGHRSDPEALFALADVAVLTSAREGLPRVVVQALAASVPMVASELPGLTEVLHHGVNGLVTGPGAPGEAASALIRLLSDDGLRARLSAGARKTDLSAWDIARLGPATTAVYGAGARVRA
jgi:glycosyltransferase involved in cell wall biosynthesis